MKRIAIKGSVCASILLISVAATHAQITTDVQAVQPSARFVMGGDPACGPGAGPCSESNGTPGCEHVECCNIVCDLDPFCCAEEWDEFCAGPNESTPGASCLEACIEPGQPCAVIGPDMSFCQLYHLEQYGRSGDIVGLAVATTSWNVGDSDLMWYPIPYEEHPFIIMNMFRLMDDRIEQIGQSHIKHGFYALGSHQCGGEPCTHEPGHAPGNWLGVGCTDTYASGLNAVQSGMGPKYELDPWTGLWEYSGSHMEGTHSHDGEIEHRLQVHDVDLDPAQNPGATYVVEGHYAMLDDTNVMNSASWKPVVVSGSPGGQWTFDVSPAGDFPNIGFAIDAWPGATTTILAQEVPVVEFESPDGRCILSAKATALGGGVYRYEYAVYNVDMNRQGGAFRIPISPGSAITNIGFHAVEHHDELFNTVDSDAVLIDNAPWVTYVGENAVTWSTVTNPLRWGTMYNFRFDANAPPADTTATLKMFRPGVPSAVSGSTIGPHVEVIDCNENEIPDQCDVDCGPSGGYCDVDDCGGSSDDNDNGIPDECEEPICGDCPTDVDGNGAVDAFDLAFLLGSWGPTTPESICLDADENGVIGAFDLAVILGDWGPCP